MTEKTTIRYSKPKFLTLFALLTAALAAVRHGFGLEIPMNTTARKTTIPTVVQPQSHLADTAKEATPAASHREPPHSVPSTTSIAKRHPLRGVWSYTECFPDSQSVQIQAAQAHGIPPVQNRQEADQLVKEHKLVNISHSPFYTVDNLTHSIPYLVPRAQHLLNTISLNFIDSCQAKGLPPHLLIVTSVMRTADDVSKLQRGNANATTNSCHCYGTTVDIAYNRFMPITGTYLSRPPLLRWDEPMKQVLSEVLRDLRQQQQCYVKYEKKQGCFHLTCR